MGRLLLCRRGRGRGRGRAVQRAVTNVNPNQCNVCYKTIGRTNLKAHLRTHTGERPFKCSICAKSFTQRCNLLQHNLVHTGEKPYECDLCSKRFSTNGNLNTHLRLHSKYKRFSCDFCAAKFNQFVHLKDHFKRKHTNKTFCRPCHVKLDRLSNTNGENSELNDTNDYDKQKHTVFGDKQSNDSECSTMICDSIGVNHSLIADSFVDINRNAINGHIVDSESVQNEHCFNSNNETDFNHNKIATKIGDNYLKDNEINKIVDSNDQEMPVNDANVDQTLEELKYDLNCCEIHDNISIDCNDSTDDNVSETHVMNECTQHLFDPKIIDTTVDYETSCNRIEIINFENDPHLDYKFESKELLIESIRMKDLQIKANNLALINMKQNYLCAKQQLKLAKQALTDINAIKRKRSCIKCYRKATFGCCLIGRYCSNKCFVDIWPHHRYQCLEPTKCVETQTSITACNKSV